jgi:hypothetical protein
MVSGFIGLNLSKNEKNRAAFGRRPERHAKRC